MNEASGVNKIIRDNCVPLGARVQRIENGCGPGVPDVAVKWRGRWGWVECKFVRAWPKREGTPVRFDCEFTPEQRLWLRRHEEWLFVRVGAREPEWFLFDWRTAQDIDKYPKCEWARRAAWRAGKVDWETWLHLVTHQE